MIRVFEEFHKMGYEFVTSSDLTRDNDNSTLFFRKRRLNNKSATAAASCSGSASGSGAGTGGPTTPMDDTGGGGGDQWLMGGVDQVEPTSDQSGLVGALLEAKSEQQHMNNWCKVLCIGPGSDFNFGIGSNDKLILLRWDCPIIVIKRSSTFVCLKNDLNKSYAGARKKWKKLWWKR